MQHNIFGEDKEKESIVKSIQELFETSPASNKEHMPRKMAIEKWMELGPLNIWALVQDNFVRVE